MGILNKLGLRTQTEYDEAFGEGFDAGKIDRGVYMSAVSGPKVDRSLRPWVTAQTGQNPDRVLIREAGALGLDYYRDILEKDQTQQTIVRRRKDRPLALDRKIVPSTVGKDGPDENDERLARFTSAWMANIPKLKQVWEDMLEADFLGYSVEEIMWGPATWEGMQVFVPIFLMKRDQNYFSFDITTHDLLYSPNQNFVANQFNNMDDLFPGKFMRMSFGPTNNPWGEALARLFHSQAWVKLKMAPGEMVALDKLGFGTIWGKTKPGATDVETRSKLKNIIETLKGIQGSNLIATPDTWEIEIIEGAVTRGGETHWERRRKYADRQMTTSGLGSTLTSGEGDRTGSLALGNVHMSGEDMIIVKISENLDETWSDQIVKWAIIINFGEQERYPKLVGNTEMIKTSEAEIKEDETLQAMGVPMTKGYLLGKYDKPLPDGVDPDEIAIPLDQLESSHNSSHEDDDKKETFAEPNPERPSRKRGERQLDEYFDLIDKANIEGTKLKDEQVKAAEARLGNVQTREQLSARIPGDDKGQRVKKIEDLVTETKLLFDLMARAHTVETQDRLGEVEEFQELARLSREEILTSPYGKLIEIFKDRSAVTDATFNQMESAARREAFSFAGGADASTVRKVQEAFTASLNAGEDVTDFAARVGDQWSSSSAHLETVWQTNAQQAYTAGVDAQFEEFGPEEYPLAELVTQRDADVRETHAVWDGFMAAPDDPVWDTMAPLNDFNCRCQKVLIHVTEAVEEGLTPTNKRTQARLQRIAPANPAFT